jgi:hypothetical protein
VECHGPVVFRAAAIELLLPESESDELVASRELRVVKCRRGAVVAQNL